MNLFLNRLHDDGTRTLGRLIVYDALGKVGEFVTLEPPWRKNAQQVSCIPTGSYTLAPRTSPKFKEHYWIRDVWGRDFILIHTGNFPNDTTGCILIGSHFADIDGDGRLDIGKSKAAFDRIKAILGDADHRLHIAGEMPVR